MTAIAEVKAKMTIAEFLERDDFEEGYIYELINGEIIKRQSPTTSHQEILAQLLTSMNLYIRAQKAGKLYPALTDVYLDEDTNLIVPDLNFVATNRLHIVQSSGYILGSPDIIVEILSKGTRNVDRGKKMSLYKHYQVKEYWIVDPLAKTVEIYSYLNNDYELVSFAEEMGEVESVVLTGFKLEIADIFD
jgi:Uma2 family endonuclease